MKRVNYSSPRYLFPACFVTGLCISFLAWMAVAGQQEKQESSSSELNSVSDLLKKYVAAEASNQSGSFNGVIFVAEKDKVLASIPVGHSVGKEKKELEATTLFEIASATKPFTAVAIFILAEQGKLGLDDSISKHLDGVPEHSRAITIRHLLTHKSGIPGDSYGRISDDMEAVVNSLLGSGPKDKPGSQREYWNQGYALLSEVIARASGMSYTEFCKKEIFGPAGMKSTCFTGDDAPKGVNVAVSPRTSLGPGRSALDHPYGNSYGMNYRGMGGIVTNVEDLWRWSQAITGGKLITEKSFELMRNPDADGYGIGWKVDSRKDGYSSVGHNGTVRGFFAEVRLYPDKETCLFLLANNNDSETNFRVIKHCEEIVTHQPLTAMFPPVKADVEKMKGIYRSGNRVLILHAFHSGSDYMPASIDWGGPVTRGLLANDIDGDVCFFDGKTLSKLEFETDKDGRSKGCELLDIKFSRDER